MFNKLMVSQLLTTLLIIGAVDGANHAMKANIWEAQCELATQLRKTPGQTKNKLGNLIEFLKTLNMIKLQLQVYAAAYPTSEYSDGAEVLAAQAAKLSEEAIGTANSAIDTTLSVTAITADLAVALTIPIMTIASSGGNSNYCLNSKVDKNSGNGEVEIDYAYCKALELDTLQNTDGMDPDAINREDFPKHPAATGSNGQGQASQCGMFTTTVGVTNNPGIKIGGGDTFTMGYGTITMAADDQPNTPDLTNLKQAGS
uniref:Variant surface glycoprotein 1899 n=1 Tax=Trypanosoma brucei TaxID=5691 RepID=M4TCR6_9TRYP|nr:variant surface glycoprotein 1899 [Trypanosoma brucei]